MILREQRIVGKEIVIDNQGPVFDTLGPGLELVDCHVIAMRPSLLTLAGVKMERGCFEIKEKLSNQRFGYVVFEDVKFIGKFSGCDFGSLQTLHGNLGGLSRCDFSHANLNQCRLMAVDVDGCVFPGWPTVVVMEPRKHASELTSIPFPGKWGILAQVMADSPEECSATVLDIHLLIKKWGGEDQELHQIVRAHSFMRTREQ